MDSGVWPIFFTGSIVAAIVALAGVFFGWFTDAVTGNACLLLNRIRIGDTPGFLDHLWTSAQTNNLAKTILVVAVSAALSWLGAAFAVLNFAIQATMFLQAIVLKEPVIASEVVYPLRRSFQHSIYDTWARYEAYLVIVNGISEPDLLGSLNNVVAVNGGKGRREFLQVLERLNVPPVSAVAAEMLKEEAGVTCRDA